MPYVPHPGTDAPAVDHVRFCLASVKAHRADLDLPPPSVPADLAAWWEARADTLRRIARLYEDAAGAVWTEFRSARMMHRPEDDPARSWCETWGPRFALAADEALGASYGAEVEAAVLHEFLKLKSA